MLKNIKIGKKLGIGFFIVAIIVGFNGVIGMINVDKVGGLAKAIYENEYPVADASMEMDIALEKTLHAFEACLWHEKGARERFDKASKEFSVWSDTLESRKLSGQARSTLSEVKKTHAKLIVKALQAMAIMDNADEALASSGDEMEKMDLAIEAFLDKMIASNMSAKRLNTAWKEIMAPHDYIIRQGAPEEKRAFADIRAEIEAWPDYEVVKGEHENMVEKIGAVFGAYDKYLNDVGRMRGYKEEFHVLAADLTANVITFEDEARKNMANSISSAENIISWSKRILITVTIFALLIAIVCGIIISRSITMPLNALVNDTKIIATGDLSHKLSAEETRDEIGALVGSFKKTVESLKEIAGVAEKIAVGDLTIEIKPRSEKDMLGNAVAIMAKNLRDQTQQIIEGTNTIASSISELSTTASELASTSSETSSSVSEVTATVEEVKQTAELSSEKARLVAEQAEQTLDVSGSGKDASRKTGEGMGAIKEEMAYIADSIMKLSEQMQSIGEIINSVNDIADQSNLLSVNASIEAAKAGEYGKGFAVVAQEVKSLADQSKEATNQVRTILNDIQKATSKAVMATERGTKAVEKGVNLTSRSGDTIGTLAESIAESAQSVTQIFASSEQQLVGMDQLAQAMESIKDASMQNVDGAKQLEEAVKGLEGLGRSLKEMAGRFKV